MNIPGMDNIKPLSQEWRFKGKRHIYIIKCDKRIQRKHFFTQTKESLNEYFMGPGGM